MRPPLSAIEPTSSGVSKVTRGDWASASTRLMAWTGCAAGAPGAPGTAGACAPGAPGLEEVGACAEPGCVVAVVCWVLATGALDGGKAACQPTMISTESTMAMMKFFWSI